MFNLGKYKTLVFDCDGVVLNSNKVKTQAFYDVAKIYGHEPAKALKIHHMQNGGISRYKKFEYLLTKILKKPIHQVELDGLLLHFSKKVKNALLACEVAEGLEELRKKTNHTKWFIVSGGDQGELREVFSERDLDGLFDGGIFGSPDTKDLILEREVNYKNIQFPALFIGDSEYDYEAANRAGLDFIFLSGWTEFSGHKNFFLQKNIVTVARIEELLT